MVFVNCDHGFGSGRFFHTHTGHSDETEVRELLNEIKETSSNEILEELVNMMDDPR